MGLLQNKKAAEGFISHETHYWLSLVRILNHLAANQSCAALSANWSRCLQHLYKEPDVTHAPSEPRPHWPPSLSWSSALRRQPAPPLGVVTTLMPSAKAWQNSPWRMSTSRALLEKMPTLKLMCSKSFNSKLKRGHYGSG